MHKIEMKEGEGCELAVREERKSRKEIWGRVRNLNVNIR